MSIQVRPSAVAGSWYPGNAQELSVLINDFLSGIEDTSNKGDTWGLIVPHAGYLYSGRTAAHGFAKLRGSTQKKVAILAPMHRWAHGFYFAPRCTHYETPLGQVAVDTEALETLARHIPITMLDGDEEHALEIQLPFLQHILGDFVLLPLMIGHSDIQLLEVLVEALAGLDDYRQGLWIASSDLNHESDYETVVRKDAKIISALKENHLPALESVLMKDSCTACGRLSIITLLRLAHQWGHSDLEICDHLNSGDVTGEKTPGQYTVGYVSAVIK